MTSFISLNCLYCLRDSKPFASSICDSQNSTSKTSCLLGIRPESAPSILLRSCMSTPSSSRRSSSSFTSMERLDLSLDTSGSTSNIGDASAPLTFFSQSRSARPPAATDAKCHSSVRGESDAVCASLVGGTTTLSSSPSPYSSPPIPRLYIGLPLSPSPPFSIGLSFCLFSMEGGASMSNADCASLWLIDFKYSSLASRSSGVSLGGPAFFESCIYDTSSICWRRR
mmetsp:Transcript_20479/g.52601  ORF Transcript_20479/g.52601 Transcript_20479/m.52601 type:complete len:226 (+) Transcript_20479:1490-2167(+)